MVFEGARSRLAREFQSCLLRSKSVRHEALQVLRSLHLRYAQAVLQSVGLPADLGEVRHKHHDMADLLYILKIWVFLDRFCLSGRGSQSSLSSVWWLPPAWRHSCYWTEPYSCKNKVSVLIVSIIGGLDHSFPTGYPAEVVPVFDPLLSPRNLLILSHKP